MNSSVFFLLAGVLLVAGLLLWIISRLHRGSPQLNTDKYRKKWLEIERLLKKDDHRSCQFAVIEADKLLDNALKERGVKGETMGERLKSASNTWTNRDSVWNAHRLRNKIVHEAGVQVGYDMSRRALAGFKRALKDVGAI
jgi:hypothetical protein